MNPIYTFQLSALSGSTTVSKSVKPIYDDSLAIEWALESDEQYYRSQMSGKLKFITADYDWINGRAFDTKFTLSVYISRDGGASTSLYWQGVFYKTDCEWDDDNKILSVTPSVLDAYTDVLEGIDNEYNLIELAPEIQGIKIDKRPMVQIYTPGESVVACFLSGMYWEQECTALDETSTNPSLGDCQFGLFATHRKVEVSGCVIDDVNGVYHGDYTNRTVAYTYTKGAYEFHYEVVTPSGGTAYEKWEIIRVSDSVVMWNYASQSSVDPGTITLNPVAGSGATGTVTAEISIKKVYGRIVTDVEQFGSYATSPIISNDMVPDNRNYSRCLDLTDLTGITGLIKFHSGLTSSPTKYGIFQPGQYYEAPYEFGAEFFPVAKSMWDELSVWYKESAIPTIQESYGRQEYTLKDAYPIASVISVLLNKIGTSVTHQATTDYSQFLYGTNPQSLTQWKLFITPKSNILAGNYDQPAQKAPITLRQVLDMLRDCFRCYWYISSDGKLKIENVQYFLKGESYNTNPSVGIDLTSLEYTRNGKKWAFATSQYKFDKVEMPERYEFSWMDDVTELFEGIPIEINSGFVEKGKVESVAVANFTSDVDYMLLNPSACDEDGFALLAPLYDSETEEYKLPYLSVLRNSVAHVLQNGYMAFYNLQQYYMYDMPARSISAEAVVTTVRGVKKQKTQDVVFPLLTEPDLYKLIKTNLGSGRIEKLSINLSSRKIEATLQYDTV